MILLIRSWFALLRASGLQTIGTTILITCLLFLGNVLGLLTYNSQQVIDTIQPKLGMFFYLNDDLNTEVGDTTALSLVEELKEAGLQVSFYTKKQAFNRLSQQLPNILDDLETYGIGNPLPPTLYILFHSDEEYQIMKSIVIRYHSLISNADDLTSGVHFTEQEKRVQTVINAMNTLQSLGIGLIIGIVAIIIAFLSYSIVINVTKFHEQISLEKLLGASLFQVMLPFIMHVSSMILVGFLFFLLARKFGMGYVDTYTLSLFSQRFTDFGLPEGSWLLLYGSQLGVLLIVTWLCSSFVLGRLIGKKG